MFPRHQRKKSRPAPEQLSLPLDCSLSERGGLSRSRAPLKAKRKPWPQALPATNPASHGRHGSVPATFEQNRPPNSFRQPQRFVLTSLLSTLISNANGKRWLNGSAL